jgi:hypothetical protein
MTIARTHAVKYSTVLCVVLALASFSPRAKANDEDPPSRVARLAYAQGSVSFQPAGTDDWVTAGLNRPVTTGDKLWSDNDGRMELQLAGSLVRLSSNTGVSFLNLSDHVTQIQLTAGTLLVRVRRLDDNETYEIDTPNLAFSVQRPGVYRITVNEAGDSTGIKIRSGEGEVTGGGAAYTVHANEYDTFSGTDQLSANSESYGNDEDQFDTWAANRDRHWENSNSSRYVSADVVGYEDLDDHGSWRQTPDNGNVWFPRTSVPGWAPYHYGHWDYIEPWGYTWVDDEPWGFAPFHYGRWVSYEGSWGWVPAPARVEGVVYVRPVYAPALVAWVGGPNFAIGTGVGGGGYAPGESVGWFPLGPREVYVPSYRVSRNYVNNVNISNTTVNTTVVNNYYNNTVVNNNVNVTNVRYVNQNVPGAVAATTPQAFTSAQPVAKNSVKVDQREVASAPVRAFTPTAVPAKQAVLGTGMAAAKPPAALQTRAVVAKIAPPPPPPSFEKRQEAIKSNGGKPLSVAQRQQIQPVGAHTAAPVRIAPVAAKPVAVAPQTSQTNRPGQPQNAQPQQGNRAVPAINTTQAVAPNATRPPDRPADRPIPPNTAKPVENKPITPTTVEPTNRPPDPPAPSNTAKPAENKPVTPNTATPTNRPVDRPADRPINSNNASQPAPGNRPAPSPVHPNEIPAPPRPVVPPSANSQLDGKHQQEQEQLHAKQQQERQAVQQQQEQDHAKLAQQQADQAKKQQLEQQHQQQTQQLQQKHAEEQKLLQEKQQQEHQDPPKPKKDDRPPQAKP